MDGAGLAEEVGYAWDGINEAGLDLLSEYADQDTFTKNAGEFADYVRGLLNGEHDPKLNAMNWTNSALGYLLVGANMIANSAADSMVCNWAMKCLTAGCLAASVRLIAPEIARRAEWN